MIGWSGRWISSKHCRPAGAISSAWAVMSTLGMEGYLEIARQSLDVKGNLVRGIESLADYKVLANEALLIPFRSETLDMMRVLGGLVDGVVLVSREMARRHRLRAQSLWLELPDEEGEEPWEPRHEAIARVAEVAAEAGARWKKLASQVVG